MAGTPQYVVRNMELSITVPTVSVQNKKNVFLLMALSQFLQEDLHAGAVHVRRDQGIQGSVMRRKGHIGVGEPLDDLNRHEGPQGNGCQQRLGPRWDRTGLPTETSGHRKQDSLAYYYFGEAFILKSP
ncbi:MAG: hypothetical protein ACYCRD_08050 [Leptospirillum sp.]